MSTQLLDTNGQEQERHQQKLRLPTGLSLNMLRFQATQELERSQTELRLEERRHQLPPRLLTGHSHNMLKTRMSKTLRILPKTSTSTKEFTASSTMSCHQSRRSTEFRTDHQSLLKSPTGHIPNMLRLNLVILLKTSILTKRFTAWQLQSCT